MTAIQCPQCGLYSPGVAERCDCGYDFASGKVGKSYLTDQPVPGRSKKKKTLLYRIVATLIGLFVAVVVVFVALFGVALAVCGAAKET